MPPLVQNLFSVPGLVAVITGGGTGIDLYGATAFAANGAKAVYIVGRREAKLKEVAAKDKFGIIIPLVGDESNKDDLRRMAAQVKAEQGYVNLVWANAGMLGPSLHGKLPTDRHATVSEFSKAAFEDFDMDEYYDTLKLNIAAPFFIALAFLELLDAGNTLANVPQKSQIIDNGSIGGYLRTSTAGWAYQPSKAGVTHLVKMMSTYFGPWKIRANCLAPGLYPSEMSGSVYGEAGSEGKPFTEEGGVSAASVPLECSGDENDIAGAILFMASRAGGYLNGTTIVSDGGRLGQYPASY